MSIKTNKSSGVEDNPPIEYYVDQMVRRIEDELRERLSGLTESSDIRKAQAETIHSALEQFLFELIGKAKPFQQGIVTIEVPPICIEHPSTSDLPASKLTLNTDVLEWGAEITHEQHIAKLIEHYLDWSLYNMFKPNLKGAEQDPLDSKLSAMMEEINKHAIVVPASKPEHHVSMIKADTETGKWRVEISRDFKAKEDALEFLTTVNALN